MDIPAPPRNVRSTSMLVGSPNQINASATQQVDPPDSALLTRPEFARSATTPSPPSTLRTLARVDHSRKNRVTSSLHRLTHYGRPQEEREWTVFGQLLENDGSRSPGSESKQRQNRPGRPVSVLDNVVTGQLQSPVSRTTQLPQVELPTQAGGHPPEHTAPDYDSDDSESTTAPSHQSHELKAAPWYCLPPTLPPFSPLQRNILKCAVAYFLASLFTFVPQLSGLISDLTLTEPDSERLPHPSGHMVATVAVYFNPAKTVGGMFEADRFCLLGLLYAAFISLGSMSMYWWLEVHPGWEWLADVLVIVWVGLGMSGVAWMKLWMNKPTFNTACSMTSIILFVVVVKEGGLDTLLQVSFIVFVGAMLSNATCFLLWPQTATTNLQENMIKTLDSFSTVLQMLVGSFLLEEPLHRVSQDKLQRAVENHQASFTSLRKNLAEARSEMFSGTRQSGQVDLKTAYQDAVDSMNRLAQHLNGLRSGSRLQYDLAKAHRDNKPVLKATDPDIRTHESHGTATDDLHGGDDNGKGKLVDASTGEVVRETDEATEMRKAAANMFGELVDELGPPLKALSATCTTSLKRLREVFVIRERRTATNAIRPQEFDQLMEGIERALFTFDSTSNHAMIRLYRKGNISSASSTGGDNSMLTDGSDYENVFLVYFFIFTLQEFASDLLALVDATSRINKCELAAAEQGTRLNRLFIGMSAFVRRKVMSTDVSNPAKETPKKMGLKHKLSSYLSSENSELRHRQVYFPKVRPHAPNTIQTPARSGLSYRGRVEQSLWKVGDRLKEPDSKFAFKAGMATAILAAPAFFDATRPVFVEYRGEWALISFFVVMSPTIGATNYLSVHRILGSLFGAATAAAIWSAFPENPIVLSIFGFFFSIPCFYYIVATPQYASASRFVLLAYNLTCLYCYNIRARDVSVVDLAIRRSLSVTVGVVWAGFVSRYWWPAEARRELSKALGEFCLNMGWLYTRLVASNSYLGDEDGADADHMTPTTETTSLLKSPKMRRDIQEFMSMELHLQIGLIELQGLLAQTQHEPRLKGPFPIGLYRSILTKLQSILDKLHSMRCVMTREEWHTNVRRDFIIPVNRERREMVGNIILYFSVLSSAFRLKSPLPPYLPPAAYSQERLVEAIRKLDVVKRRNVKGSRQLLFFAYALTMKGVIQELDYLGKTLQDAFGVIGHNTEDFEALFRVPDGGSVV